MNRESLTRQADVIATLVAALRAHIATADEDEVKSFDTLLSCREIIGEINDLTDELEE